MLLNKKQEENPMSLGLILKLLHILAAIGLISGIVGRGVTFRQAARTADVHAIYSLLQASGFFEQRMVIPGSMLVLLLGLVISVYQKWPLFGFLQGSHTNWLLASIVLYLGLMPAIPLYLLPRRKQRARAAEEALAQGVVTQELATALTDRGVISLRTAELVVAVVVATLMITKPF
jgi:uncharacterized membrane protein